MNGRLRRDMQAAFGAMVRPGFIFATYLCFAVPATIILLTKMLAYDAAAALFAAGTAFTTMSLGGGAYALAHDMNDLRLPRRRASLLNSHAAIMLTIVSASIVPGLLVAVFYRDWVLAATAIGAALFPLLLLVLPFYAVSAIIGAMVLAAFYRDGALFEMSREYVAVAVLPAEVVLAALALWRWRAVLERGASKRIFGFQRPGNLSTASRSANLKRWPDWMFVSMSPVRSRPSPARAIRTFFGEPYAPVPVSRRLRQSITQGAIPIAVLMWVFYVRYSMHDAAQTIRLLALPALGGAAWVVWIAFSRSLTETYRHGYGHGEMIELSLLPGLGAARARRRSLYEACLAPPILMLIGLLVAAILVAWMEHRAASTYAGIMAFAISALLVIAAGTLRILIGKDSRRSSFQQVGATGLFLVTFVAAVACATGHGHAKGLLIAHRVLPGFWFAVVWVTSTVVLYKSARQLSSRPHPFAAI